MTLKRCNKKCFTINEKYNKGKFRKENLEFELVFAINLFM